MSADEWDYNVDTFGKIYVFHDDVILRFIPDAFDHGADHPDLIEAWEQMYWGVEKGPYSDYPGDHMACSRYDNGSEIGFSFDLPTIPEYNCTWREFHNIDDDIEIVTIVHGWTGVIREEYVDSIRKYINQGGREWFL